MLKRSKWELPVATTRGDVVARSALGAAVPRSITSRVSVATAVKAWAPFTIALVLGIGYWVNFPSVELVWLRVLYLLLAGGAWSGWQLVRIHYAKVNDSMQREYTYAREELAPALSLAGAIVTTSETIRLMKGEEVEVGHNTNLYLANSLRLAKEPDGTHALQFLFR